MDAETDTETMDAANASVARRKILAVTAAAVGGVALVACGSDDDDKTDTQTPNAGGTTAQQQTTGAQTPSSGGGATSGGASGEAVAKTSEVPVGGGKIDDDTKVVVTQPTAGTYKAFSSICTHQGCPVASVSNNVINCNCHGSKYSAVDGSVQQGPATRALAAKKITVSGDQILLQS